MTFNFFDFEAAWKEVTRKYLIDHGIVPRGDDWDERVARYYSKQGGYSHTNQPGDTGPNGEDLCYEDREAIRKAKEKK